MFRKSKSFRAEREKQAGSINIFSAPKGTGVVEILHSLNEDIHKINLNSSNYSSKAIFPRNSLNNIPKSEPKRSPSHFSFTL